MKNNPQAAFAERLNTAIDGHPLAPPTPHGRQRWLIDKLAAECGLELSPNSMNKWVRGMSKPKEENIRLLAKVLGVDEVWLAMGRTPAASPKEQRVDAGKASGAELVVAGLLEMQGHRVSFPGKDDPESVSLWVNVRGDRYAVTVITPQKKGGVTSFVVPEPAGSNAIIAVSLGGDDKHAPSASIDLIDLTDVSRQDFGGFSVVTGEARPEGKVKIEGRRGLLAPVGDLSALLPA